MYFGVLYTILRENFVYRLKTVSFLKSNYMRCVIKYKLYHFCKLTKFLKMIENEVELE